MFRSELPEVQLLDGNRCPDVLKGLGLRALSSFGIAKSNIVRAEEQKYVNPSKVSFCNYAFKRKS
jgi:hypothetical protein